MWLQNGWELPFFHTCWCLNIRSNMQQFLLQIFVILYSYFFLISTPGLFCIYLATFFLLSLFTMAKTKIISHSAVRNTTISSFFFYLFLMSKKTITHNRAHLLDGTLSHSVYLCIATHIRLVFLFCEQLNNTHIEISSGLLCACIGTHVCHDRYNKLQQKSECIVT